MQVPLEIAFDNVEPSDWIETDIRERAAKLDSFYGRITACRVRVITPHKQHRTGNVPTVHIELSVPGKDLVVSHAPHRPEDRYAEPAPTLRTVIRDAFKAAERQLKDFKQQIGGEVKPHDVQFHGQVSQLYPNEDHGFLLTNTGTQLYFHRNSVLNNDFDKLKKGDLVHYVEAVGDTGPTASKVRIASQHDLD
jgi:cold shock CspA family protein